MSCSYAKLTYSADPGRSREIPVGVALWSKDRNFCGLRVVRADERLSGLRHPRDLARVQFVGEKLLHWMSDGLPYAQEVLDAHEDRWWNHARELLIQGVRITSPCPIDVEPSGSSLDHLFASVVAPHTSGRQSARYINGRISDCLGEHLAEQFTANCRLQGFEGREVRVTRAYRGRAGWVIIEGLNLMSDPDHAAYVALGKLLSLRQGTTAEVIVGYVPPVEHGLNGEASLLRLIAREVGARAFDLNTQADPFREAARASVAKVGEQPRMGDDVE